MLPLLRRFSDRLYLGNVLTVWYSLVFICMYYHTFDISDITLNKNISKHENLRNFAK